MGTIEALFFVIRKSEAETSKETVKKESDGSKNGPSKGRAQKAGTRRYVRYRERRGRPGFHRGCKEGGEASC